MGPSSDEISFKINEIFCSIQGESSFSGLPCTFIRLTGCPLRCTYCDTEYAFFEGEKKTLTEILQVVKKFKVPLVEVTGGEPLAHKNTPFLLKKLLQEGYRVLLETAGSHSLEFVPPEVHIVMDLKTPGSGMEKKNLMSNFKYLKSGDEIKFVLCDRNDYDWAVNFLKNHQPLPTQNILFSPVHSTLAPGELGEWMIKDSLPFRLQIQLHKILWDPTRRGV